MADVIFHRTEFPMNIVNVPFVAAVLNAHFETESLADSRNSISRNISVFTLLAELKDRVNGQMDHTRQVYYEELVGETSSNRTKITTELFSNGRQATIDDLLAALANFDALLTFMLSPAIDAKDVVIINAVRLAFNKLAEPGLRTWFAHFQGSHPWLCHAFLADIHTFLSEFMTFSQDATSVKQTIQGTKVATTALDDFQATFDSVLIVWQTTLKGQSVGPYAAEPMTWRSFSDDMKQPPSKKPKTQGTDVPGRRAPDSGRVRERRPGGSDPDKGLFSYAAGVRPTGLPQLPGGRNICMGFCKQGSVCSFENCKYAHLTSNRGSVADLEAVDAWIVSNPGVSWVGGKPALLQTRRRPNTGPDTNAGTPPGPAAPSGTPPGPARG